MVGGIPEMIDRTRLPRHVAIIMDGNGRWAQRQGLPRVEGHKKGADAVRDTVRAARELGLQALTLYAFSMQNWDRPADEVAVLMQLLHDYCHEERSEIMDNAIRLVAVGEVERLPGFVRKPLDDLMRDSAKNQAMTLCLALSYGGREAFVDAARALAREAAAGQLDPDQIDEACVQAHLCTSMLPQADLIIRTSGELRISNFLLWEAAYAELYFTETLWPDFTRGELYAAIEAYQRRERRFGRTGEQARSRP
ncbi:MAG TPA: polyprenyl diphosphate synthase [Polyangia bacterium]|nr:polyprenyl diphosphate synthase [Polyangia bacterium]